LDADESYKSSIIFTNGKADPNIHETYIDVEPTTGFTFNARKRVQINALLKNSMIRFPKLNTTFFPVFWFEIFGTIGDGQATDFKNTVIFGKNMARYMIYGSIGGIVFSLLGVGLFILAFVMNSKRGKYIEVEKEEPSIQ